MMKTGKSNSPLKESLCSSLRPRATGGPYPSEHPGAVAVNPPPSYCVDGIPGSRLGKISTLRGCLC